MLKGYIFADSHADSMGKPRDASPNKIQRQMQLKRQRQDKDKSPGTTVKIRSSMGKPRDASPNNKGVQHWGKLQVFVVRFSFFLFFSCSFSLVMIPLENFGQFLG